MTEAAAGTSRPLGIRVQRVYEVLDHHPAEGEAWVLVDRLWPRGVATARLDATWDKDIAPSTELRTDYHHQVIDEATFDARYRHELAGTTAVADLLTRVRDADARELVLLVAAKHPEHSHVDVLADALRAAVEADD